MVTDTQLFSLLHRLEKTSLCTLLCLSEAAAEASESHLQLCSWQPRRADLLWGRGDRGGRRGGPGVVGQYLSDCCKFTVFCVCALVFGCLQHVVRLKHKAVPSPAHVPALVPWMPAHAVTMAAKSRKPWPHSGWYSPSASFFSAPLLLPLWNPLCEHQPAATCFPPSRRCKNDRI